MIEIILLLVGNESFYDLMIVPPKDLTESIDTIEFCKISED